MQTPLLELVPGQSFSFCPHLHGDFAPKALIPDSQSANDLYSPLPSETQLPTPFSTEHLYLWHPLCSHCSTPENVWLPLGASNSAAPFEPPRSYRQSFPRVGSSAHTTLPQELFSQAPLLS